MNSQSQNNIVSVGMACTGCGVCANICPKSCITLKADNEGFLYPKVNNSCVNCGKCRVHCPQLKSHDSSDKLPDSYIGITKNYSIYKRSASGGIFATVAHCFLESHDNSYVCGASYCGEEQRVKHIIVSSTDSIELLQNSKYVQSDISEILPQIKQLLSKDFKVLFCGTPCQVNALYSFLGNRHIDNLVTMDLICHGVPSPKFLKYDISQYVDLHNTYNVHFRWKNQSQKKARSAYFLTLMSKSKHFVLSSSFDPYFASFMRNGNFRMCCYSCKYANLTRCGDITIGDCDSAAFYPDFFPGMSKSTIIINTEKGMQVWDEFSHLFDYTNLDLKKEASINHQLDHPSTMPPERMTIYHDIDSLSFAELKRKYAKRYDLPHRVLFYMQRHYPTAVQTIMKILKA